MKSKTTITIARPIDEVWHLVAEDFTSIARWSESVVTSDPLEPEGALEGATMGGRYCTFTPDPNGFGAKEMITEFDRANFTLRFDVEPVNAPAALPIKANHVTLTLKKVGASQTEVVWIAEPELKFHGYLLYPMLAIGLRKSFQGILEELKTHAEGQPQPGKQALHLGAVG